MLESLRKNQKWVIWAIAFAFIIGMAITGISTAFSPKPFVGKIYGKKVHYQEYDKELRQYISQYMQQNPQVNLDDQTFQRLNDDFWRQYTYTKIMEKQLKKYHIKVTDEDLIEAMKNEPPVQLQQNPSFQTNGQFDKQKYLSLLETNQEFVANLEQYMRQYIPYSKLEKKVKAECKIVEDSARIDYIDKNDFATGKVIVFDINTLPAETVTDAEISAYYEKNKEEKYKREDGRKFKFVKFVVEPSKEDVAKAKTDIDAVYTQLNQGEDFAQLAKEYSQDPGSAQNGGDLGFVGKNRMVKEFEDAIFGTPVGQISKPFKTSFGWHIVKVVAQRKNEKGEPEVQASHILVSIAASEKTKMDIKDKADMFYDKAKSDGLEKAAKSMNLQVTETQEFDAKAEYIPMLGRFPHLVKIAFKKGVGHLEKPLKIYDGSYVIPEISFKSGAHFEKLDDVKNAIRFEIEKQKKSEKAFALATAFSKKYPADQYLVNAPKEGLKIIDVNSINKTAGIPELGEVKELNAAMHGVEAGNFTSVIKTDKGSFIALVTARVKPDMNEYNKNKAKYISDYRSTKENQYYSEWYKKVMDAAKVEDYRYMYY